MSGESVNWYDAEGLVDVVTDNIICNTKLCCPVTVDIDTTGSIKRLVPVYPSVSTIPGSQITTITGRRIIWLRLNEKLLPDDKLVVANRPAQEPSEIRQALYAYQGDWEKEMSVSDSSIVGADVTAGDLVDTVLAVRLIK